MRWATNLTDELRLRIARDLEGGAWDGPVAALASRAWSGVSARTIARRLEWPASKGLVAIGGATLGGSGKTPLAIACARGLASHGVRVALVAHSYRARPGEAHVVAPDHDVRDALVHVGDEALMAARSLAGVASVVVAPTRQQALDHAFAWVRADLVVVDGVLQTAPRRASLSLLALDGETPWGAGRVVPRGDLRAAPTALLEACDSAVLVEERLVLSLGARHSGTLHPWRALAPLRLGLFTALARPSRILAHLARRGVHPRHVVSLADHARPAESALARRLAGQASRVDLWLASPKCALLLEAARVPHAVIDHQLVPGAALAHTLAGIAAPHPDRRLDPAGRGAVI